MWRWKFSFVYSVDKLEKLKSILKNFIPRRFHPVRFKLRRLAKESRHRERVLGNYTKAILTEGYNGKLLIAASDMVIGRSLAERGAYNKEEIEFHLNRLDKQSRVLIVGAHVGSLLVPIARKVGSVAGIEANPDTFNLLIENIRLNELTNVELYQCAAGEKDGEAEFLAHTCNTGASKLSQGILDRKDPVIGYDRPKSHRVKMRRLDDLLGDTKFDLIIMDVEGSEYSALSGMQNILDSASRLQVELVPFLMKNAGISLNQVFDLLEPFFAKGAILTERMKGAAALPIAELRTTMSNMDNQADLLFEKS